MKTRRNLLAIIVIIILLAAFEFTTAARAQTIPNPSFEANSFTASPGYTFTPGNGPISGWFVTGSAGLNPAGGNPFADNGAVPQGSNVAFIQSLNLPGNYNNGVSSLLNFVSGLAPGIAYTVSFRANSRTSSFYGAPAADWSLDSGPFVPFTAAPSVGGANAYYTVSGTFIATGGVAAITIRNRTAATGGPADTTVLVDDFTVSFAPPVVTNTADSGPGSLRQAIANAAAFAGADTVTFDPSLSGATITLASEIVINDASGSVTVDATSLPAGVTIDGGAGTNRLFSVSSGQTLALLGLTLTGGKGGGAAQNSNGGAIVNFGTLALTRCTLTGHSAGSGGAILNDGGAVTLTQCSLSGNSAFNGGAIYQTAGTASLTHCTLFANQATVVGALYHNGGALTLTNSIVAENTDSALSPDIFINATMTANGVNFIGDPTGSGLSASATLRTTAANGPINLTPLGSNGGPTKTMVPRPGSPAMDGASFIAAVTTDQRGFPRPAENGPSGELPDIGAVEVQTAVVTTAADQLDTPTGPQTSLREALRDGADRVVFSGTFTGDIRLGSPLAVAKYVSIDASAFASGVIVSGNNVGRIFHIAPDVTASFTRLILTNGYAATNGFPTGYGGGVYVEGALTLTECTLQDNGAYVGAGAFVANNAAASLTLIRSAVFGNGADFGGGIQNEGTLVAQSSTFAGNVASVEGGAISAPFNKPVTLRHCTVSRNTAATGGGVAGGDIVLENSIVAGNTAPTGQNYYGGVSFLGASFTSGDPLLAPLGNYGGPTQTMALQPGSFARNAATGSTVTSDQRGFPIVGQRDSGAYEAGTFTNYNAFIWETLPATATTPQHASGVDFDGDGVTNVNEWLALTDAADPASYLRITQLVRIDNDLQFNFPSVLGRNYTIEFSLDLATWTPIGGVFPGPGGPFTLTYTHFFTGNSQLFLRIRVGP